MCGYLGDIPLILLDGRCHLYEGYTVEEITLPVRVVHACAAPLLIVSNASGGLNPRYARGDMVVIEDHLSFMNSHARQRQPAMIAGPCRAREPFAV